MEPKDVIETAFQTLITTKHLYQNIEADFEPVIGPRAQAVFGAQGLEGRSSLEDIRGHSLIQLLGRRWVLDSPGVGNMRPGADNAIHFSLPLMKTMCGSCHSIESFNAWTVSPASTIPLEGKTEDVFCIPIQCQACRSNVIVFLVSRTGTKVQLVGRSEFEEVQVPAYIPKEQKKFYSQALIAFNSGQILPALFLLRTLIEQHMRAVTKSAELRGEDLCDEYGKTLTDDFKRTFPSFKTIYSNLSDAIHKADCNEELFDSQLKDVELHFEGATIHAKAKIKRPTVR